VNVWKSVKIGDICQTASGGTPNKSYADYYKGGTIPWLMSGEVAQGEIFSAKNFITQKGLANSAAKLFPENSVLIAMYGATAGQVGILRFKAASNQAVCAVLPSKNVLTEFMFYAVLSKQAELISQATGNAQPNISQIKIKNTEIPLPPLPEQRRIVAILDEAFAGLDAMRANAEKNLQNAHDLFDSYLNAIFTEKGEGWVETTLDQLAIEVTDGDHAPPPKSTDGVPFITISNIHKGCRVIDFTDTYYVSRAYFDALKPSKKPRIGDVLYTVTGSFGIPVLIEEERDFCFQRHIGLIRPKAGIDSKWLSFLLQSEGMLRQAIEGATGTAQKTVSLKVLRGMKVPKMPLETQKRMAAQMDELQSQTRSFESLYRQKLAAIAELKQSILQKAFAGELTSSESVAA
jgi:restriction endonuclease S subunit